MISQYWTRVPFLISAVINRKDVLATTPAHSVTTNTNTKVNTLKNFLKVSNRLSSSDDPPVCGTGGSWKESHSFLSFWYPRELQFKKFHFIIPHPIHLQPLEEYNIIHNRYTNRKIDISPFERYRLIVGWRLHFVSAHFRLAYMIIDYKIRIHKFIMERIYD